MKRNFRPKKSIYRPLVYICAPFSGDRKMHLKNVIFYAEFAYKNGAIPVTPHFLFPFLEDDKPLQREDALFMDIILLGKCDEVWVFGDEITEGMKKEITVADRRKQTIRYFCNAKDKEGDTNDEISLLYSKHDR